MAVKKSRFTKLSKEELAEVDACEKIIDEVIEKNYPDDTFLHVSNTVLNYPSLQVINELVSRYTQAGWHARAIEDPNRHLSSSIQLS